MELSSGPYSATLFGQEVSSHFQACVRGAESLPLQDRELGSPFLDVGFGTMAGIPDGQCKAMGPPETNKLSKDSLHIMHSQFEGGSLRPPCTMCGASEDPFG